ncbi:hypothetical protein DFJ74DRAFT_734628, partial [Hyaloraphidium curvatum]
LRIHVPPSHPCSSDGGAPDLVLLLRPVPPQRVGAEERGAAALRRAGEAAFLRVQPVGAMQPGGIRQRREAVGGGAEHPRPVAAHVVRAREAPPALAAPEGLVLVVRVADVVFCGSANTAVRQRQECDDGAGRGGPTVRVPRPEILPAPLHLAPEPALLGLASLLVLDVDPARCRQPRPPPPPPARAVVGRRELARAVGVRIRLGGRRRGAFEREAAGVVDRPTFARLDLEDRGGEDLRRRRRGCGRAARGVAPAARARRGRGGGVPRGGGRGAAGAGFVVRVGAAVVRGVGVGGGLLVVGGVDVGFPLLMRGIDVEVGAGEGVELHGVRGEGGADGVLAARGVEPPPDDVGRRLIIGFLPPNRLAVPLPVLGRFPADDPVPQLHLRVVDHGKVPPVGVHARERLEQAAERVEVGAAVGRGSGEEVVDEGRVVLGGDGGGGGGRGGAERGGRVGGEGRGSHGDAGGAGGGQGGAAGVGVVVGGVLRGARLRGRVAQQRGPVGRRRPRGREQPQPDGLPRERRRPAEQHRHVTRRAPREQHGGRHPRGRGGHRQPRGGLTRRGRPPRGSEHRRRRAEREALRDRHARQPLQGLGRGERGGRSAVGHPLLGEKCGGGGRSPDPRRRERPRDPLLGGRAIGGTGSH